MEKLNRLFILNIILGVLVLFGFVSNCNTTRKASRVEKTNITLVTTVDSLSSVISSLQENAATKDDIKVLLDDNMLEFLFYEEEVDKGRMSLGELRLKIKEENKQ